MDWEYLFKPHILERGFDYFAEGRVMITEASEDHVTAELKGSGKYEVEIDLIDGEVAEMFCTCPHANEGNHCKHMAAVLYAFDDWDDSDGDYELLESWEKRKSDYLELIREAPEKKVREFLAGLFSDDSNLALKFRDYIRPASKAPNVAAYQRLIDNIIWKYSDYGDYIGYEKVSSFIADVIDEMTTQVSKAIVDGYLVEAFVMAGYTFTEVADVEMDDSDGVLMWFSEECTGLWQKIYDDAEENDRKDVMRRMFDWCKKHINGTVIDFMEDEIETFLSINFDTPEYQKEKEDFLAERIEQLEKAEGIQGFHSYQLDRLLKYRLNRMKEQGEDWETISEFCKEHWENNDVRMWFAQASEARGELDDAIRTLEESKSLDQKWFGLVQQYESKLWKLYLQKGDRNRCLASLTNLLTVLEASDLEAWRKLRDMTPVEQWEIKREQLISGMPSAWQRCVFYQEEQMTEKLMEEVMKQMNLSLVRQYQAVLLPEYSQEILHIYVGNLQAMVRRSADRKRYREVVNILREMKKIPGGEKVVLDTAEQWKKQYKNRPAMMEELGKL